MKITYRYNGVNLKDYGVSVSKGKGFLGAPSRKEPKKYEYPDEHGYSPDLTNVVWDARTITLDCYIVADSAVELSMMYNKFTEDVLGVTSLVMFTVEIEGVMLYISNVYGSNITEINKEFSKGKNVGTFTVELIDPHGIGTQVFGYRFPTGQADDRVEAVNDIPYDTSGIAPEGSRRAKLLNKLRPYQCNHDGSNVEYLRDNVAMKANGGLSDLTDPLKLQMTRLPHFYYRMFEMDEWTYVLFCEQAPEAIGEFMDATQWKEIKPCGYPRYRGVVKNIDGQSKLLSFSGEHPTVSRSLINFQADAKRTNPKATVTPYYIYEAITLLMVLELGRRNTQVFYTGITNAGASYANAAVTGVTDTLTTPSGEVDVEYESGQFTKQFRWRFIECVYGQIWNFLTGIYYVYDEVLDMNKVYITRDPEKINTNSDYSEYIHVGNTPASNGYVKEMIPGMIECSELGGSSTTYWCDYHYTSNSATTRTARSGGHSAYGGSAGPFALHSPHSPAIARAYIGAALVLPD